MPVDIRTRSSVMHLASRTAAVMLACDMKLASDMKHGMLISDLTLPNKREGSGWHQNPKLSQILFTASSKEFWLSPKLTAMLKYLVVSTRCLDSATDPVIKLKTDFVPAFLRNLTIYFLLVYQLDAFLVPDRSEDGDLTSIIHFLSDKPLLKVIIVDHKHLQNRT